MKCFSVLPIKAISVLCLLLATLLASVSVSAQQITAFSKTARNVNDNTGDIINNARGSSDTVQRYTLNFSCTGAVDCTINVMDDIAGMAISPVVYPGQLSARLLGVLDTNNLVNDSADIIASVTNNKIDLDLTIPAGGSFQLIYRVNIPNQRYQDGTTFTNAATITPTAPTTVANTVNTTAQHTATLEADFSPRAAKSGASLLATGNRVVKYTVQACSDGVSTGSEILWENGLLRDTLEPGTAITDLNGWTLISPIPADGSNTVDPVIIEFVTPEPRFRGCYTAPVYEATYNAPHFADGAMPMNTVTFTGNAYGEPPFSETAMHTGVGLSTAPTGTDLSGLKLTNIQSPVAPVLDIAPPQIARTLYDSDAPNAYYFPFTLINTDDEIWEVTIEELGTGSTADFFNFNEVNRFGFRGASIADYEFTVEYTTAEIGNSSNTTGPTQWARCPSGDGGSSDGWCQTRTNIEWNPQSGASALNIPANHYITGITYRVRAFNFQDNPRPMGDNFQTVDFAGLFFTAFPRATSLADGSSLPTDPTEFTNCADFKALDDNGAIVNSSGSNIALDLTYCDQIQIQQEKLAGLWTDYAITNAGPYTIGDTVSYNVRVLDDSVTTSPIPDVRMINPVVQVELAPGLIFTGVSPHTSATIAAGPENATLPTCAAIAAVGFPSRQILECTWPANTGITSNAGVFRRVGLGFSIDTEVGPTALEGAYRTNLAAVADPVAAHASQLRCDRSLLNTTNVDFTSGEAGFGMGGFVFDDIDFPSGYHSTAAITSAVCRDPVDTTIQNAGAFISTKLVGPGNIGQVVEGITRPGEASSWYILVQNTTTDPVNDFLSYDKLPFVGDTSIFTGDPRNSKFVGPLTGPATNTVIQSGVIANNDPLVIVEYSTEANPCFDDPINAQLAPANQFTQPAGCVTDATAFTDAASVTDFSSVQWIKIKRPINDDPVTVGVVESDLPGETIVQIELPFLTPANRAGGDEIVNDFSTASSLGRLDSSPATLVVADGEIGDRVWLDTNNDGQQDATDIPVQGVSVALLTTAGAPVLRPDGVTPYTTTTNASGNYLFDALKVGNYVVEFDWSTAIGLPNGLTPAALSLAMQDIGGDDTIDSDGATIAGMPTKARAGAVLVADANGLPINTLNVDMGLTLPSDLQVIKTVAGIDTTTAWSFAFTLTGGAATVERASPSAGTGNVAGSAVSWTALVPGTTYTLTETLNTNYVGGTLVCQDSLGATIADTNGAANIVTFVAPVGDANVGATTYEINCAITNTALTSDLQVTKTVAGQGTEDPINWSFAFALTPAATNVSDPSPATNSGNTTDVVSWSDLVPGDQYVLSETATTGYVSGVLTCSGVTDSDGDDLTVTFVAPFGDDDSKAVTYEVNCAIINTADTVEARVAKTVAGVNASLDWSFDFTITPTSAAAPTAVGDLAVAGTGSTTSTDTVSWTGLLPGAQYVIAETAQEGYTAGAMTCTGVTDTDAVDSTVTFIAPIGDSNTSTFEIDCAITNTAYTSDIEVTKTVAGQGAEGPIDWSFVFALAPEATDGNNPSPATNAGNTTDVVNWSDLVPGTKYVISETATTGYTSGELTCTGVTDSDFDDLTVTFLAPLGDDDANQVTHEVNCAITNTVNTVEAQVTKTVSGVEATQDWDFDFTLSATTAAAPTMSSFDLVAAGTGPTTSTDTVTWSGLLPGAQYTLSESAETGYTLGALTCTGLTDTDGSLTDASITFIAPVSDDVNGSFEVDCAITNIPLAPDLRVTKTVATNATADWEFNFTLSPTATAQDTSPIMGNGSGTAVVSWSAIVPGTEYTVSEVTAGLTGYTAGALTCEDANGIIDDGNATDASVTFTAPLGDDNANGRTYEIDCTITNQQWPDLVIAKTVAPPTALADGTFVFSVEARNDGVLPVTGVEVTDVLPAGLVYQSHTPAGEYNDQTGIWTVGDLNGGDSTTLELTVQLVPEEAGCDVEYVNTASITNQNELDFDPSNHTSEAICHLISIASAKTVLSGPTAKTDGELGDSYSVTFQILVKNTGGVTLNSVNVVDDLAALINEPNVNYATIDPTSVSVESDNNSLTPNPLYDGINDTNVLDGSDSLAAGAEGLVEITFEITPDVYFGPFLNQASVSGVSDGDIMVTDLSEDGTAITNTLSGRQPNAVVTFESGCVIDSPTSFMMQIPPTPITLGWFKTTSLSGSDEGGLVLFEWDTELEVANAGFDIEVQNAAGDWLTVNDRMIASQGDSTKVQSYSYEAAVDGNVFRITDISVSGKRETHGDFELGAETGIKAARKAADWNEIEQESDQKARERDEQLQRELQELLDGGTSSGAPSSEGQLNQEHGLMAGLTSKLKRGAGELFALAVTALVPSAHAFDIATLEVPQSGIYQVSHADLAGKGLNLSSVAVDQLSVKFNGEAVPVKVMPANGASTFVSGSTLRFAAHDLVTSYVQNNTYVLAVNEGQRAMSVDSDAVPSGRAASSYMAERKYAPQNEYSHFSPEKGDSWYAERLLAISGPAETEISINVDAVAPVVASTSSGASDGQQAAEKPSLNLKLWGGSALQGNGVTEPDHRVTVDLNGERVTESEFDGLQSKSVKQTLSSLDAGNNEVKITLPKDHGYAFDIVNIDEVSVRYPRRFYAEDNGTNLVFASDWTKFRVRRLASQNVAVYRQAGNGDVTEMTGRDLNGCATGAGSCIVAFKGGDGSQDFTYYVSAAPKTPTINLVSSAPDILSGNAETLVIAHADFIGNAKLAAYVSSLGNADMVDVSSVYAAYTGHIVDASAIAAYIKDAYAQRGTKHVVLVGGDTYDYHNNLGTNAKSFIPSLYVQVAQNLNAVPSDAKYADIDDDQVPDVGMTRLPVRSTAELNRLLTKRTQYLGRSYGNKAVFGADKVDAGGYSFKADAESMIAASFAGWNVSKAYMDDQNVATAKASLINKINQGAALTSYFGHSSTDRWSLNGLLTGDEVANLQNTGKPTVVAQWGCWNTFHVSPEEDSLAHRFLTETANGAVTVMGASSYTQADGEKAMGDLLYKHLDLGKSISQAVLDAKQELALTRPYQLDVLLGWATLGPADMVISQ